MKEERTTFEYGDFSCSVDIFRNGEDIIVRFYDKSKEQEEKDIKDLVIVDPGYGYICLKFKGEDGLLSGFLDEDFFSNNEIIGEAVEFVENLSEKSKWAYIPHHIDRVKLTSYVEYNGEY